MRGSPGRLRGMLAERLLSPYSPTRAARFVRKIEPFLADGESLLDIGSGSGHLSVALHRDLHLNVEMIDLVPDWGYVGQWLISVPCAQRLADRHGIPHRLYPGGPLPFADGQFDTTLLAFVMHHADDPEVLLKEATRIAKRRVIVFEDIPKDGWETRVNAVADAVANLEIAGHPHTNKRHEDWLALFAKLGLHLIHEASWKSRLLGLPAFPNTLFVLEKV